jgi:hypothetical protein
MKAHSLRIVCAAALAALSACASSRYFDARYAPTPADIPVTSEKVPGSQIRALASIVGVARADQSRGTPVQVEVRLRLENLGTVDGKLAQEGLSLVSGNLFGFEPGRTATGGDVEVPAGQTRIVDVVFSAPPDKPIEALDWEALNLRFTVWFGERWVAPSSTFTRVYYGPSSEPQVHVGFGVGYVHH